MSGERIIRIEDIRKAGHCPSGARTWFKLHGLDFRRFLKDGIPAHRLLETGDAQAVHVVALAEESDHG